MTWKVLISAPYMLPVIDDFADELTQRGVEIVKAVVEERLEEHQLIGQLDDIDGVICGDDRYTPKVFASAPRLKVVVKWGTGIDSINAEAAAARNIRICRTPNAFSEPVADSVMGYILCFARRLPWMDRMMKQGEWNKIPGRALNESTIGVIGVGDVGRAVLRRAQGFGMTMLGTDIRDLTETDIGIANVRMTSLDELLRASDFISLNCDLNSTSHHLITERTLALMKPTAVIVNAARGPVIDEPALVRALQNGCIAGVGMDVFEDEPLPMDSPLRSMDNVMLAPHNSNSSPRAWMNVHRNSIEQLIRCLQESS